MRFLKILHSIEELLLELVLWFLFVPKTLVKIVRRPSWVHTYINEQEDMRASENKREAASAYDDYVSPLLLFLATVLLPVLFVLNSFKPEDFHTEAGEMLQRFFELSDEAQVIFLTLPLMAFPLLSAIILQLFETPSRREDQRWRHFWRHFVDPKYVKSTLIRKLLAQLYIYSPLFFLISFFVYDIFTVAKGPAYESHEMPHTWIALLLVITLFGYLVGQYRLITQQLETTGQRRLRVPALICCVLGSPLLICLGVWFFETIIPGTNAREVTTALIEDWVEHVKS